MSNQQMTNETVKSVGDQMRAKHLPADVALREPQSTDAVAIAELIERCSPLDRNSVYSTLLLCTHFANTCAVAMRSTRLIGWVSAYTPPTVPDVLFIWQVAIDQSHRGMGLAKRLIKDIAKRQHCTKVRRIQTTITADNEPSWALFRSLADGVGVKLYAEPYFLRRTHFAGDHETEHLVTIGPFDTSALCVRN